MFLTQSTGRIRQACYDLYNLPAGKRGFGDISIIPLLCLSWHVMHKPKVRWGPSFPCLRMAKIPLSSRAHLLVQRFGKGSVTNNQLLLRSNQLLISIIMHI